MPLTTPGPLSCELRPAGPAADRKAPKGTVWSLRVSVVAPATTPSFTAVGMFTETTTLKVPLVGASRYHISTRRAFPASLCAPAKLSGVPLYVTPTTPVVGEFVIFIETPTARRRFAVADAVWAKVRVFVPAPAKVAEPDVVASTATWARR